MCAAAALGLGQPLAADDDVAPEFDNPRSLICPDGRYESGCDLDDIRDGVEAGFEGFVPGTGQCLYRTKAQCTVTASGNILAVEQGKPLFWQHMVLFPSDGPRVDMLVIVEGNTADDFYLLVAHQSDGWIAPPQLVENSAELMLVHAPARKAGSGAGNDDVILSRHDQGWTIFSATELIDGAEAMLPDGFSLTGGVHFDFREMFAAIPVKRESDGGCCATGGTALVALEMPSGYMMQVAAVRFLETQPVATHDLERAD